VGPRLSAHPRFGGLRKLTQLRGSRSLMDLRVAPRDRFEASEGIRINDRWRVCFRWQGEDARDVEIVDYH
jgi:proteic killer suppression protein